MALTSDQIRKVYKYLRVAQIQNTGSILSGSPVLTQYSHVVQAGIQQLTPAGETTVVEALAALDAIYAGMSAASGAFGLKRVKGATSEIEYAEGEGGFDARNEQLAFHRLELASVLGLPDVMVAQGGAYEP